MSSTQAAPRDPGPSSAPVAAGWSRVASHDGTSIAWRSDGPEDGPVVVLCNGIACDDVYWTEVWPSLCTAGARVIRWHYRGHGRSGAPANPEEVIVSSVVRDLQAVVEAAGVDSAVLVGHSYGVQVICEAFRHDRDLVDGLVAVAGAYGHPLGTVFERNVGAMVFPAIQMALWPAPRTAKLLIRGALRTSLPYWGGRVIGGIGPRAPRDVMDRYFEHVAGLDVDVLLRMLRAMQEHSSADVLPSIDVPSTVLGAKGDGMTPPKLARQMAEAIPGARLRIVDGTTHVLPAEEPGLVAEEILAVVDRVRGAS